MSAELIDEVKVGSIQLGNTKLIVQDADNLNAAPLIINNVNFSASKVVSLTDGSTTNDLINNADWKLSADGFSFYTKQKLYQLSAAGLKLNNREGSINIK